MRIMAISHPCVTDVNQQFYAELEALGHTVQLIVPSNFRTTYSADTVEVSRWPDFAGMIEQRKVGLSGSIPLHYYQSNLRPSIKAFRPDVLFVEEEPYSASAWQAFYASRDLPMKRVVYSAQNILKQYPLPFRWMERYVLDRTDLAAVVSSEVGEVLRKKNFQGGLLSFPLGVDTGQFRPMLEERRKLRRELEADEKFIVGYVGRFVEEKGIRFLLEAAEKLAGHPVSFVFVGKGELLEDIRRVQARHPGLIRILDSVKHNDVHRWMNAMDALALPSLTMPNWKEQFGRVIVEAMACGVPVIGSDSGQIPVLLRETGGGWIVPERDAEALAAVIRSLMEQPGERDRCAEAGLAAVSRTYSKKGLAKAFEQALMKGQPEEQSGRAAL
ncbi:Glycosyl transferase 4-like domain-containing protein [Paenibacillus sp. UNCCL117]|uniref:glycosyltransferase n=1 Tax=unclassified Paenibacillus TaxID=185978 RepID=UPI000882D495|nr:MULTISPECIES: glycosyltransferase [unclassified Paenibacillus]SDC02702.1 Glycosyl transferase 4-like domain-containing protein [Paenibacillus sp. cl123]SFW36906.1 Glycosyl transferase 4-like domain-containing protein [Paenibacillus sp. UNCCL117]